MHKPGDLARQPSPAAVLRQLDAPATARSERVQLICGQAGIGDELRLLLRADGVAWGAAQFCRESGSPHFDDAERGFIADLAPEIGAGLRRSLSHRPGPDPARVRLSDGRWLLLHGGRMLSAPDQSAQVTVTLRPVPPAGITSPLLLLHRLSARHSCCSKA